MKPSKNCPPYSLSQEHYLLYSYGFHQNKLQTIYTTPKPHNENTFFEKQLQYQTRKHSESKPLRNWNFEVRIENNALLKRMKEIKLKGTKTFQCLTDETPKNSKYGSFSKKTLNIDKRIRIIKNIMKENEFIEKRLQTVPSTINIRKIENGYEDSLKHSANISKFSRRTVNHFIGTVPINKTPQKQQHIRLKKIKSLNPANDRNNLKLNENEEILVTEPPNLTKKYQNIENTIEQTKNQEKIVLDGTAIEESKTLEEISKVKQSGIMVSEIMENEKTDENNKGNTITTSIANINMERSLNLD